MQFRHLVVIGASAGGIEALRDLLSRLPAEFPAAIAVAIHTSPQSPGIIHEILDRAGPLTAMSPRGGERLAAGRIYVAPPDFHLLIEPGRIRISKGPKENRFRPAIDPLFRSAAQVFGPAVIGVVLTGNLDDGTAGLWAVKQLGGTAIVQDPADALFPSMPESALAHVNVDHVVPLSQLAGLLVRLTAEGIGETPRADVPAVMEIEVKVAKEEDPLKTGIGRIGDPSPFACPECHGVLLQLKEAGRFRFRCHTGHAYSAESLLAEMRESIEVALWNAIRAMQEGDILMRQMSAHLEAVHGVPEARTLKERADQLTRQADTLRDMVTSAPEPVASKA